MKNNKVICTNRKAFHDYFIFEKYEAGISLTASEVKSCIEECGVNLTDAYISIDKNRLVLNNSFIAKYFNAFTWNHEERAKRYLLMHKREILRLNQKIKTKGYTLIPLSLYINNNKIKVEVGLCKGKKSYDKREALKEKQDKIEMIRKIKQ